MSPRQSALTCIVSTLPHSTPADQQLFSAGSSCWGNELVLFAPPQVAFPHFAIAEQHLPGSLWERADPRAEHGWQSGPGAAAAAHASCSSAHMVRALLMHPESSAAVPIYFPGVGPVLQHEQSDVSLIHTLSLAMISGMSLAKVIDVISMNSVINARSYN